VAVAQREMADALAVLTAAAVATTRVRLGTSVLIAPAHAPSQLARRLATIDQLSGGRLLAGVGTGWSTDELQATGATRADRGRFLEELMDVFAAVWGPDPVNHRSARAHRECVCPAQAGEWDSGVVGRCRGWQSGGVRAHRETVGRVVLRRVVSGWDRSQRGHLEPYSGRGHRIRS
jgi:hypothetical protein